VEDDAVPVDAARVDRLHALAEGAPRVDHDGAAEPPRDRELRVEGRLLHGEGARARLGILRQVEPVEAALAQRDRDAVRAALPVPRDGGDRGLPPLVHGARVDADRVPDAVPVGPHDVPVEVPVVRRRANGDHPADAGLPGPPDQVRQAAGPKDGIEVGVRVDEGHAG